MMTRNSQSDCALAEHLELYALGQLPEELQKAVEAHLALCPDCQLAVEQYRLLIGKVRRSVEPTTVSAESARRVKLAIDSKLAASSLSIGSGSASVRHWRLFVPAAAAAAVLVLATAALFFLPKQFSTDSPLAQTRVERLWEVEGAPSTPAPASEGVLIRGQNMYLLRGDSGQENVACVDISTGKQKWQSEIASSGCFAADDAQIYCLTPSETGGLQLAALDARSGKLNWQHEPESPSPDTPPAATPPVVMPNGQICWAGNRGVYLLDPSDGRMIWTHSLSDEGPLSAPAANGKNVVVASAIGLHCFDLGTGTETWHQLCDGDYASRMRPLLTLAAGQIYVAQKLLSGEDKLFCMDADAHRIRWTRNVPGIAHLLATADALYLRGQDVQAFDITTGDCLWTYKATGCGPVTCSDGLIYFVDSADSGKLVALNPNAGEKVWEASGLHSCDAFNRVGSQAFIKTQDGVVHALALRR